MSLLREATQFSRQAQEAGAVTGRAAGGRTEAQGPLLSTQLASGHRLKSPARRSLPTRSLDPGLGPDESEGPSGQVRLRAERGSFSGCAPSRQVPVLRGRLEFKPEFD